jgi:predicted metal-dependent hydrolase
MAGLGAYAAGDYFEAHELMEPAWMGTDDPAERDLISGLIKVAAADVHSVRGNPRGVARNLEGARDRLRRVPDGDPVPQLRIDMVGLCEAIDRRLADLAEDRPTAPIPISWSSR